MKKYFFIFLFLTSVSRGEVLASGGENMISLSPSFIELYKENSAGFAGARLKYRRGIDDFYNFFFSGTYAQSFEKNPERIIFLNTGFSYFIDAVNWVPEVMLGIGLYSLGGKLAYSGIFAGFALDYRRWKQFSIGVEVCYHFLFQSDPGDDSYPRILTAALRVGFYF